MKRVVSSAGQALVGYLALLLFTSLLLIVGCGGAQEEESSKAPQEDEQTTTAPSETAQRATTKEASTLDESSTLTIISSDGTRTEVQVEIADEEAEQQRGLMERPSLGENSGMLFVFDVEQPLSFWMRNTLIPLSIAYISADGRIVDIQDMQPLDETPHLSAEPAQYALEVNQGFFAEHGIGVGDVVELSGRPGLQGSLGPYEVIEAFENAGLEVGETYPVEQEPGWEENRVPKTYAQAVRFTIPSLGVPEEGVPGPRDRGGRVFVFDSEEDLDDVRGYYEALGPSALPHVYVKEQVLLLLQITNDLPKAEADRYGAVLQEAA